MQLKEQNVGVERDGELFLLRERDPARAGADPGEGRHDLHEMQGAPGAVPGRAHGDVGRAGDRIPGADSHVVPYGSRGEIGGYRGISQLRGRNAQSACGEAGLSLRERGRRLVPLPHDLQGGGEVRAEETACCRR